MRKILGLDVSLTSFGWFLQDGKKRPLYGSFKTTPKDGIQLKRMMIQRDRLINLINDHKVEYIGIEEPFLHSYSTELLYALHQFLFEVCYTRHVKAVYFPVANIKQYVTGNYLAPKPDILFEAKKALGLTKEKMNDDESDAYWVSILADRFWKLYNNEIKKEDLELREYHIFIETKPPKSKAKKPRKIKKGKPGILYKKDKSFFIF